MPDLALDFSHPGVLSDLHGAVDMHIHSTPDALPRLLDDLEVAAAARDAGMRAVVLKGHVTCTADRAYLVGRVIQGIEVYGGIVLNDPVGGLNPAAVEAAIAMGARVVWMPTMWADNHCRYIKRQQMAGYLAIGMSFPERGITVLEEDGETLKPEVRRILKLVAEHDLVLAGGHLSAWEHRLLIREARAAGITRIVVNHPTYQPMDFSVEEQVELAEMGAFMEHCLLPLTPMWTKMSEHGWSPGDVARAIKAVGAERCILSSDLRQLIQMMRESGIGDDELHLMTRVNPAKLLGMPA